MVGLMDCFHSLVSKQIAGLKKHKKVYVRGSPLQSAPSTRSAVAISIRCLLQCEKCFIYLYIFKMDISDRFLLDQKQQQQISILLLAGPQASGACSHYDVQCQKGALQIMTLLYFSIAA